MIRADDVLRGSSSGIVGDPDPANLERRGLKELCEEFEAFFLREILKGLKGTLGPKGVAAGAATAGADIQTGIADDQVAIWLSRSGGMGLSRMLFEALSRQTAAEAGTAALSGGAGDPAVGNDTSPQGNQDKG